MIGFRWRCLALVTAVGASGCLIFIPADLPDGGQPTTDGGDAGALTPGLDGGRRPATWRHGRPAIVNDVPGWFVPPEAERVLYPVGQRHSPITAALADRLRRVALHGQNLNDNSFMKVGDSITASANFMSCFDGDVNEKAPSFGFNVRLDGRSSLADPIFHFRSAQAGTTTPFSRVSVSARVGAAAPWVLEGSPSPLDAELAATQAQFATLMYGTNDMHEGGTPNLPLETKINPYTPSMLAIVDHLLERGVVPVMSTIPPRSAPREYVNLAPVMNAIVRAIAQGRQVPLVDFHAEMAPMPNFGLSSDGVHPACADYNTCCHLTAEGLRYGYNVRNLVMLEGLERAMRVVVDGTPSLDGPGAKLAGLGTRAMPYVIPSLPFSDLRDVSLTTGNAFSSYACANAPSGTGNEQVYRFTVTSNVRVRAAVVQASAPHTADGGVASLGVHLHVLRDEGAAPGCVKSANQSLGVDLTPGDYLFTVDRDADPTLAAGGEYVFIVVPCAANDGACNQAAATP